MAAKVAGAKKSKFDLGQNSDINVTPFVDVMLVLLIIFMVTAPLATVSIKLDVPPAVPPPPGVHKPPTIISIDRTGAISVSFATSDTTTENHPATLGTLAYQLAQSLGVPNPTSQQVFIHADQKLHYGQFMVVVNKLQMDGYYKLGIISEEVQADS